MQGKKGENLSLDLLSILQKDATIIVKMASIYIAKR